MRKKRGEDGDAGEEEKKREKKNGSVKKRKKRKSGEGNDLEASLKIRKGTKIYEIPKLPLIIIWVITFFPPYKNSSSNLQTKEKEMNNNSMKKIGIGLPHLSLCLPSTVFG